jgi:hypothetical protein
MSYKYKLSLCLCVKNEAKNIIDFMTHYIKQGVDHFYITNNNSNDNLKEVIENSAYHFMVTLINDDRNLDINNAYSKPNGLMTVYNNNLYNIIKKETEWAIVVDIDEFMYGKNGLNIKSFLEKIDEDVGCVYVIWNIMTSLTIKSENNNSFYINSNDFKRLNYDLINNLSYNIKMSNDFGKSLFRTSMLNGTIGLHKTNCTTGKIINNYGPNKNTWYDNCNYIDYSESNFKNVNISLNHYVIRSYADYIKKKESFECNNKQRNVLLNGIFELLNLDDIYFITDNEVNENIYHEKDAFKNLVETLRETHLKSLAT